MSNEKWTEKKMDWGWVKVVPWGVVIPFVLKAAFFVAVFLYMLPLVTELLDAMDPDSMGTGVGQFINSVQVEVNK